VSDGDCPHVLFYGPSGAGKKTLVLALLKEIFGAGVERVKVEQKEWKIEVGERKVEVDLTMMSSNYHVELNPSDVGGTKDRYVVQEVIKDMARGRLIGVDGGKGYKGATTTVCVFSQTMRWWQQEVGEAIAWGESTHLFLVFHRRTVLVLNEVDKLSREAQHALRRTMEKYSGALGSGGAINFVSRLSSTSDLLLRWVACAHRCMPPDACVRQHQQSPGRCAQPYTAGESACGDGGRGVRPACPCGTQGEHQPAHRICSQSRRVLCCGVHVVTRFSSA